MRKIYQIDEVRVIKRFLFIRRQIDNERRWLEVAKIQQTMKINKNNQWKWVDTQWIN